MVFENIIEKSKDLTKIGIRYSLTLTWPEIYAPAKLAMQIEGGKKLVTTRSFILKT